MKKNGQSPTEPGIVFDEDLVVDAEIIDNDDALNGIVDADELHRKSAPEPEIKAPDFDQPDPADFIEEDEEVDFVVMSPDVEVVDDTGSDIVSMGERGVGERGAKGAASKKRIGDQLVEMGVITADQLNVALQEQKISGKMIGELLVDLGFIDAETLGAYLAQASGFKVFDPKSTILDSEILAYIKKPMALKHSILPVSKTDNEILVAMADPYDVVALDILRQHIPKGLKVKPIVGTPKVLADAIDAAYGHASTVNAILKELEGKEPDDLDEVSALSEEEAYSHPLVRLVNSLIFEAVKTGASDLHFEPEENFVRLRYRIDGTLATVQILHKQHWNGIGQRIKLMANLNIADKLTPQDGRIKMNVGGHEVDFRVSSLPTVHGENIVMRVLDKQASIMPLSQLGFSDFNKERIDKAQKRPEGIIIVTGPTGSGKTTTLYSMLNEINTVDVNIQTLEDPVEYSLPMIRQTAVREGILEFADGIRALLRQDPDIIFIGEIRDKLTAEMALQAAMTGHQVYTSLHTNDSFGALPRLWDLGMVPGMVAGNIISIFAQRLARTLCSNCKEAYTATDEECQLLGVTDTPEIFRAQQGGCNQCGGQGYKGRVALAEILLFDEEMDEIVGRGGTKAEIKHVAVSKGFKNMRDDAMVKILEGKTTFEAVAKVVDVTK